MWALAAAGCAAQRPPGFADRFVVQGEPAMDLTAPAGASPSSSTETPERPGPSLARSPAAAPTPPPRPVAAATLEDRVPELRRRLEALAIAPTATAHLDAAALYRTYGVHDRAFDLVRQGLTRYPRDARLHAAAAAIWRDWGFPDRGLRDAYLAVRYAPASAEAHTTLATILWDLGARRDALTSFADALRAAPGAAYARENWCRAARALSRPDADACTAAPP